MIDQLQILSSEKRSSFQESGFFSFIPTAWLTRPKSWPSHKSGRKFEMSTWFLINLIYNIMKIENRFKKLCFFSFIPTAWLTRPKSWPSHKSGRRFEMSTKRDVRKYWDKIYSNVIVDYYNFNIFIKNFCEVWKDSIQEKISLVSFRLLGLQDRSLDLRTSPGDGLKWS
jgi:hypothetical protein